MPKRSTVIRRIAPPVALLVAGVVVAVLAGDSTLGIGIAIALVGCAGVVAVALVFFAVGEAEDRDRERTEAARRARPGAAPPPEPERESPDHPQHPRTLGLGRDRRHKRPPRRPQ
jgi:Na+/melibiose symporter-like transporter